MDGQYARILERNITDNKVLLFKRSRITTIGLLQEASFAGDLRDSKSTPGGVLCALGSQTFVPMPWKCKKQTAVSHNSAEGESEILDAVGFVCQKLFAHVDAEALMLRQTSQRRSGKRHSLCHSVDLFLLMWLTTSHPTFQFTSNQITDV